MVSRTFQTNTFTGGMDMDTDISMLPNNKYRYAENLRLVTNADGTTGVIQKANGITSKLNSYLTSNNEIILGTDTTGKYGVIITRDTSNNYLRIYRVIYDDTVTVKLVLTANISLKANIDRIALVLNYESDENVKVYFSDGENQIRMFNIMDDTYASGAVINDERFDLTPGSDLRKLDLVKLGIGSLPVGVVQYCYQLFNPRGTETAVSPLSNMIHLTTSTTNQSDMEYEGAYPNTSSNKSVTVSAYLTDNSFEKCRIIRISYINNNELPVITVVDEINIETGNNNINYTDTGTTSLAEITIDEFNNLVSYQFSAVALAKLQNRLFAANITELTWDPGDYDARAYRCNINGQVKLESSNNNETLTFNIEDLTEDTVPKEHDCINPFNTLNLGMSPSADQRYEYTVTDKIGMGPSGLTNIKRLGGSGLNIEYYFITTRIVLSEEFTDSHTPSQNLPMNTASYDVRARQNSSLPLNAIYGSTYTEEDMGSIAIPYDNRILNYADPYIDAYFKGYQRDEVYRFGIVFYNSKNIASPVYWIGDIRFPDNLTSPAFSFEDHRLYGYPIGVRFIVKNAPEGAVSYEIVRCDRTENDRSIINQVAVTNLYDYKITENSNFVGKGSKNENSIEMRPTPFLTRNGRTLYISYRKRDYVLDIPNGNYVSDYIKLISPETCLQREDMVKYIDNSCYLVKTAVIRSAVEIDPDRNDLNSQTVCSFATPSQVELPSGSIRKLNLNVTELRSNNNRPKLEMAVGPDGGKDDNKYRGYVPLIAKYFFPVYTEPVNSNLLDVKYSGDIPYNSPGDVSPYKINVGDRTYTNFAMTQFVFQETQRPGDDNDQDLSLIMGQAGPGLIAQVSNGILTDIDCDDPKLTEEEYDFNAICLYNVKRSINTAYSGNTFNARTNSVYVSIGAFDLASSVNAINVFGGDTYLGILDYPVAFVFQGNDIATHADKKVFSVAYIPFETSINTNLFNGDMAHRSYTSNNTIDIYLQMEPQQTQNFHSQDRPYFVYNSVYSSQNGARQFVPKSPYAKSNTHIGNRIVVSQAKTNDEIFDNWSSFKVGDYLDVDSQYGEITNLKTFKDRLFYFQDEAVGIASVNERSLVTDDNINQVVLGTGGILSRFDYITTHNGSSMINNKTIVDSDYVLYWYDNDKKEICAYSDGIHSLSKEKNVQSYLNDGRTITDYNCVAFFNKKDNEVWFNIDDKPLIFNEQIGVFTSFYTQEFVNTLTYSKEPLILLNVTSKNIVALNSQQPTDDTATIQLIVNKDVTNTKVFDNLLFAGNIQNNTISNIVFNTKNQESTIANPIFDYRENTYRIPIPRQNTNNEEDSLSFPARMRGKIMTEDYTFANNVLQFEIPYITTTYRYSLV